MKSNNQVMLGRLRRNAGSNAGFTLIEVMIVVVVVAILTAVAYPSYRDYIIRANRSAAQTFMLEVASRQERFLLDARAYAASIAALGMSVPPSVSTNYTITSAAVAGPPPGYTVTATPVGKQLADDTKCGTLTIDATGAKTASGSGGVSQCWKQ
jgi:type IV pilus assembly protein PilE